MPDSKFSGLTAGVVPVAADVFASVQSAASVKVTASQIRQWIGAGLTNSSVSGVAGYAADTYLAGSAITIPTAGAWRVGTQYYCLFDMTKTAAGTAAFTVTLRMGTLGTTGDAGIMTMTYGAGTAAVDAGLFTVLVSFHSIGGSTAATVAGFIGCSHHLAATGLISTGASGYGMLTAISAGFNSTTQTIIGLSVNGGAGFSGTNFITQAYALNI